MYSPAEIIGYLETYISPRRRRRIRKVVRSRVRGLATVVEGVYDMGNVSAVMRTAEGLGILPFHIIATGSAFKESSRTTQGADKWLEVTKWRTVAACVDALRADDYTLVATDLEATVRLSEIDFSEKTALVFGNEAQGISQEIREAADIQCLMPMAGFAQSYNISVAAAMALSHARSSMPNAADMSGDLSPEEQEALIARYYLKSVKHHEQIIERLTSGG